MALTSRRNHFDSDIVLGQRYRDEQTGFEGVATGIAFYQHACERVTLEAYDPAKKEIKEYVFDAPRLVNIATQKRAEVTRTGGPRDAPVRPSGMSR